MEPDVLYLIVCNDVQTDPQNYQRLNILGLTSSIWSNARAPFPLLRPLLTVLVVWIGGSEPGELQLRIVEDRSGRAIFRTRPRQVRFVGDPTAVGGVTFRIRNCSFPAPGLYWVEVLFAG